MGNDADWTATAAGESEPGPRQGDRRYFDAYNKAVSEHGVKSSQANAAVRDAISHGWSPGGISQALIDGGHNTGSWPSGGGGGGRRSAGETRRSSGRGGGGRRGGSGGSGGLAGPKSPPVDQ